MYFEMAKKENGEGGDKVEAIIVTSWCKIALNSVPASTSTENNRKYDTNMTQARSLVGGTRAQTV